MAAYSQHVVVSSGRSDWKSKIEDEKDVRGWGRFTSALKSSVGPKGLHHDPYNNIMVSTSSFQPVNGTKGSSEETHVLLFPSFVSLNVSPTNPALDNFVRGHLLPKKDATTNHAGSPSPNIHQRQITQPTILICSHDTRDRRCGVLGPLLRTEFSKYLSSRHFDVYTDHFCPQPFYLDTSTDPDMNTSAVNVGLISHIGGHKWAGNIILYIPPGWKVGQHSSPLAGTGIWYGRVEPKHVSGIVQETLVQGNVIRDLFRGGIDRDGRILRL